MYTSSMLCCSEKNACWKAVQITNPPNDQNRFGLEPHFMREILEWNIPIIIGGITYTPLCQEYPGSPGIDLVYLGSNSSMVPSHVRVVVRLHMKHLTGERAGQPLSSETAHSGCRPSGPKGKATLLWHWVGPNEGGGSTYKSPVGSGPFRA
jgi:hypothetical protein